MAYVCALLFPTRLFSQTSCAIPVCNSNYGDNLLDSSGYIARPAILCFAGCGAAIFGGECVSCVLTDTFPLSEALLDA